MNGRPERRLEDVAPTEVAHDIRADFAELRLGMKAELRAFEKRILRFFVTVYLLAQATTLVFAGALITILMIGLS